VPAVCGSSVDYHSPQFVVEELVTINLFVFILFLNHPITAYFLGGKFLQLQLLIKLAVVVYLCFGLHFEVELKPFETNDQIGR
jgi:hypothetical protein